MWLSALLAAAAARLPSQPVLGDPGQNGPHILGSGYLLPTPVSVAPGQLLTLMVNGTMLALPGGFTVRASAGTDLPNTLAGVSVSYGVVVHSPAPILAVHAFYGCVFQSTGRGACTPLGAVTVQIPFGAAASRLEASVEGASNGFVDTQAFADQVHVLTTCDTIVSDTNYAPFNANGLPCPSVVTHADGSPVSVKNPAQEGEEIVAWAVGLGQTNPPLQTGKLVTAAVPTQTTFGLDFNYKPNALASKPLPDAPAPVFAGATPGYVGLYQINFVVPPPPAGTPPCVEPSQPGQNVVYSNLTVSVGGQSSFDGARICVAVPNS